MYFINRTLTIVILITILPVITFFLWDMSGFLAYFQLNFFTAYESFRTMVMTLNVFFPVNLFFLLLRTVIQIELIVFTYKLIVRSVLGKHSPI